MKNHGLVIHSDKKKPLQQVEIPPNAKFSHWESELTAKFEHWTNLLEGARFSKAEQEIIDYLSAQEHNAGFNKNWFRYFLSRYASILTAYAENHQFPLNQLIADPKHAVCFEISDQDLDSMKAWVSCSLTQLNQRGNDNDDPVSATKSYIKTHLAEELDMAGIAENVHLNQDYLTRIFKKETGISIKNYVVNKRLERAKELLETSSLPIADIAYQVGYYNYTSFNRIFKKCYGISPQSFRHQTEYLQDT